MGRGTLRVGRQPVAALLCIGVIASLAVVLASAPAGGSVPVTFDGGGDGTSWTDPLNWSSDVVPGAGDSAIIPAGFSVSLTSAASVDDVGVQDGATVTLSGGGGVLTMDAGGSRVLDVDGTFIIKDGATIIDATITEDPASGNFDVVGSGGAEATFVGVTFGSDITLTGGLGFYQGTTTLADGITLTAGSSRFAPGSSLVLAGTTATWHQTSTMYLDHTTTLTLPAGLTLLATNSITITNWSGSSTLINNGTIHTTAGSLTVNIAQFDPGSGTLHASGSGDLIVNNLLSNGTGQVGHVLLTDSGIVQLGSTANNDTYTITDPDLQVPAGTVLRLAGTYTNTGNIVGAGGLVELRSTVTPAALGGIGTGQGLSASATTEIRISTGANLDLSGGPDTLAVDPTTGGTGQWRIRDGGTITGGTITETAPADFNIIGGSGTEATFVGVTFGSDITLTGGLGFYQGTTTLADGITLTAGSSRFAPGSSLVLAGTTATWHQTSTMYLDHTTTLTLPAGLTLLATNSITITNWSGSSTLINNGTIHTTAGSLTVNIAQFDPGSGTLHASGSGDLIVNNLLSNGTGQVGHVLLTDSGIVQLGSTANNDTYTITDPDLQVPAGTVLRLAGTYTNTGNIVGAGGLVELRSTVTPAALGGIGTGQGLSASATTEIRISTGANLDLSGGPDTLAVDPTTGGTGQWRIRDGGTITGGTITETAPADFNIIGGSGTEATFVGVTFGSDITLTGGLGFYQGTTTLADGITLTAGSSRFAPGSSLVLAGTTATWHQTSTMYLDHTTTLTLPAGLTLLATNSITITNWSGSSTLINNGTIHTTAGSLTVNIAQFDPGSGTLHASGSGDLIVNNLLSNGTGQVGHVLLTDSGIVQLGSTANNDTYTITDPDLQVPAGTVLRLAGTYTNTGNIVGAGGLVELRSTVTPAALGGIGTGQGLSASATTEIRISTGANLDLSGGPDTLAVDPTTGGTGQWRIRDGGTITGGTITETAPADFNIIGGSGTEATFVGVTFGSDITLTGGLGFYQGTTTLADGITLTAGSSRFAPGSSLVLAGTTATWHQTSTMYLDHTTTLTLPAGLTLLATNSITITNWSGSSTLINNGTIHTTAGSLTVNTAAVSTPGHVIADGATLEFNTTPTNYAANVLFGGTWEARAGGDVVFEADSVDIHTIAAEVVIDGAGSTISRRAPGLVNALGNLATVTGTASLEVTGGGSVTTAATLTTDGPLEVGLASTLTAPAVIVNDTLAFGGSIVGNLDINGTLTPGESPGEGQVTGNLTFAASSTYAVEIDGTNPGITYDRVTATGNITVDGSLAIDSSSFSPATADTFEILFTSGGTRTGQFATVSGSDLGDGRGYIDGYGTDDVTLSVQSLSAVSVADVAVSEGARVATLTIVVDPPTTGAVTVDYSTSDGTATEPGDYTATVDQVTFAANETEKDIDVPIVDDGIYEGTETFDFKVTAISGALAGDTDAVVTITENESFPVVTWTAPSSSAVEDDATVAVDATLSPPSAFVVEVDHVRIGGNASLGSDLTYTAGTLTFPAETTAQSATFDVIEDTVGEANETIQLRLQNASGATVGSPSIHTHTILDDDPKLSFSATSSSINEAAGTATVTVQLQPAAGGTLTVEHSRTGGSASPADHGYVGGTLEFLAGETSKDIVVPITDDLLDEFNESIVLTLSNLTGPATLFSPTSHTLSIVDDDPLPDIAFTVMTSTTSETAGTHDVELTLSEPSGRAVTGHVHVTGGSATSGDDYSPSSWSVPIPAGNTTASLTITLADDVLTDGDETIELTLNSASNATVVSPSVHTVTIVDDEVPCVPVVAQQLYTASFPGPQAMAGGLALWPAARDERRRRRGERRTRAPTRWIPVALLAVSAGALVLGFASSLPVDSDGLGSGSDAVEACDPDGVIAAFVLEAGDPGVIDAVNVVDVESSLDGHTVHVTVRDASDKPLPGGVGSALFTWNGSGDSGDVLVDLPGASAADTVEVTVTVVGPAP